MPRDDEHLENKRENCCAKQRGYAAHSKTNVNNNGRLHFKVGDVVMMSFGSYLRLRQVLGFLIMAHEIIERKHHGLIQIVLTLVSLTIGKPNVICEGKRD